MLSLHPCYESKAHNSANVSPQCSIVGIIRCGALLVFAFLTPPCGCPTLSPPAIFFLPTLPTFYHAGPISHADYYCRQRPG